MSGIEPGRTAFGKRFLRARSAAPRLTRGLLIAVISCTFSGCAALSPQIFSERLSPSTKTVPGSDDDDALKAPTVAQARADIETVQKKYATAIQDLSNITPRTSAALIGISATALYKALTGGSTKGIAALGVAGSGIWAYGATMTSQPRQRVYAEGIRALSCAITAASPYDRDEDWTSDLDDEIGDAATAFESLRDWQEKYADLNKSETIPGKKAAPASAECAPANAPTKKPPCTDPSGSSTTDDQILKTCAELLTAWQNKCKTGKDTPERVIPPSDEIKNAFKRAQDEQARLATAVTSGRNLKGTMDVAGTTLQDRSTDIQVKVSGEVLKTEPDPTAVLATLKNLSQVASTVAGVSLTVPAAKSGTLTGTVAAQGARVAGQEPSLEETRRQDRIRAAIEDLDNRLNTSYSARVALESRLAEVDGSIHKVNRTLDQCEFTAPGTSALVVSPSATNISVPLGSSQTFTVSGGTGIPLASVNAVGGAKVGNSERKIDGGAFTFSYMVPTDGSAGDQVVVMFTDASHQSPHEVTITAATAQPPPAPPAAPAAPAPTK